MGVKLPKFILTKVQRIHRNNEQNIQYAKEINKWFEKLDIDFDHVEELLRSKIVKGEVTETKGKKYLKVKGYSPAEENLDGTFCNQVQDGEDWYHGEFYIRIDDDTFLQIFYDC